MRGCIRAGMAAGSLAAGAAFLTTGDPSTGLAALAATTALGGAMGAHMTASIGGADMPVVITLLNSYSGCVPAVSRGFGETAGDLSSRRGNNARRELYAHMLPHETPM